MKTIKDYKSEDHKSEFNIESGYIPRKLNYAVYWILLQSFWGIVSTEHWNRRSRPEVFCKKGVLKKFCIIHRKTPLPESLLQRNSDNGVFLWILPNSQKHLFEFLFFYYYYFFQSSFFSKSLSTICKSIKEKTCSISQFP